ncbi:hypothetical protein L9F63_011818, partial [Diploptera punctata]
LIPDAARQCLSNNELQLNNSKSIWSSELPPFLANRKCIWYFVCRKNLSFRVYFQDETSGYHSCGRVLLLRNSIKLVAVTIKNTVQEICNTVWDEKLKFYITSLECMLNELPYSEHNSNVEILFNCCLLLQTNERAQHPTTRKTSQSLSEKRSLPDLSVMGLVDVNSAVDRLPDLCKFSSRPSTDVNSAVDRYANSLPDLSVMELVNVNSAVDRYANSLPDLSVMGLVDSTAVDRYANSLPDLSVMGLVDVNSAVDRLIAGTNFTAYSQHDSRQKSSCCRLPVHPNVGTK